MVLDFTGNPSIVQVYVPTQIGVATNWSDIKAVNNYNFAIKTDGTLWAWGSNLYGQLGDGTISTTLYVPTQIGTDTHWSKINAASNHSIALKSDGSLWCWGSNNVGQIGDGTIIDKLIPTPVACPTSLTTETIVYSNNIKIYPNPAFVNLNIEANDIINETCIIDCNDRVINVEKQNNSCVSINIENLQQGIYFLKIVTENSSTIEKILKQ